MDDRCIMENLLLTTKGQGKEEGDGRKYEKVHSERGKSLLL